MSVKLCHNNELLREFKVARYQPGDIILIHRATKRAYQFYQISFSCFKGQQYENSESVSYNIQHPLLIRPTIQLPRGLLYPKPSWSLQTELQTRKRSHTRLPFQEEEILNTFRPVMECLRDLHMKGVVHGSITKEHIVVGDRGEVRIRDWGIPPNEGKNNYYRTNNDTYKEIDDWRALGLMMAETASLKSLQPVLQPQIQDYLSVCAKDFSKDFLMFVVALAQGMDCRNQLIQEFIRNDKICFEKIMKEKSQNLIADTQKKEQSDHVILQRIYSNILQQHQQSCIPKPIPTQPLLSPMESPCQASPTKKFNITSSSAKKSIRLQECSENRRAPLLSNEDVKRKHIDKITRIIQRSNAFVNELMSRRASDANKKHGYQTTTVGITTTSKLNASLNGIQNNSYGDGGIVASVKRTSKDGSLGKSSPNKRLRVIQKKKLNQ